MEGWVHGNAGVQGGGQAEETAMWGCWGVTEAKMAGTE
jgi:hypothetical protein